MQSETYHQIPEKPLRIQLFIRACNSFAEGEALLKEEQQFTAQQHLSFLYKASVLQNDVLKQNIEEISVKARHKTELINISDIGQVYVTGSLSSLLLEKIDGKALGSIEGSLQGILHAYGLSNKQSKHYLRSLKQGKIIIFAWRYADIQKRDGYTST